MSSNVLALCDTEQEYVQQMGEFLKSRKDIPWEVRTYTNVDSLLEHAGREAIGMLVVAENAYTDQVQKLSLAGTLLLNESGIRKWDSVKNVDKYQRADKVLQEILSVYLEVTDSIPRKLNVGGEVRIIGIYSPVRRCLQTTFALTLGQILACKSRVLYLNFEHYAGITELLPDLQTRDLTDLLYFLATEEDKFQVRMQTMIQKKGELDYIPPMRFSQNMLYITGEEWRSFLQKIAGGGEYKYIILDLSENMQGLFDILRMCFKVFTLLKEDNTAQGKILQYEQVLAAYEYDDVLDKTFKCSLPLFKRIPGSIEQFTRGDLADYVNRIIREVF